MNFSSSFSSQSQGSMINSFKNKIQLFLPSNIKDPVNKFLDILDKSLQIKGQSIQVINEVGRILKNITDFVKQQINTINLSGQSKALVTQFFDSLVSLLILIGLIISYTKKGGLISQKKNKTKKHKKTRRH